MISAIILVGGKVNESLYKKCLDSLSWVDEIIQVETDHLPGSFSQWRNLGASKAKGDWLLYIDTDEEVNSPLKDEISEVVKGNGDYSAYAIPRANILLGKKMKYGGWSPDYVLRLFKKDALISWEGELHEQPKIRGAISKLMNPLMHTSHRSISEMIEKTNKWSEIEAKLLFDAKHPPMNIARFMSSGLREFFYRGIKKMGFLDGIEGVIEVFYQSFSRLITYAKLWELQINESRNI